MSIRAIVFMGVAATGAGLALIAAGAAPSAPAPAPVGGALAERRPGAYEGYTLIATNGSPNVFLIDMDGKVVHTWETAAAPASSTYLLETGNLLRPLAPGGGGGGGGAGRGRGPTTRPTGAAAGGRIQEIGWDGAVTWAFDHETPTQAPHHDVTKLPNGNYLFISWDTKTAEQGIAAGRNPTYQATGALPPDCIFEVQPNGTWGGKIVWEWHVWDHLVQYFDKEKPNFGDPAKQPERIDINYSESWMDPPAAGGRGAGGPGAGGARGAGGGGRGGPGGAPGRIATTDWTHLNSIAYNAELDQIVVSSYTFSEFWIIDHSTTMAEAASHAGGKGGKGGDLLYRFGNPAADRAGKNEDQILFCQHNVQWIDKGLSGAGNILLFNNGPNRPSGEKYSEVDEFTLPVDKQGHYAREANGGFTAAKLAWSYRAPNKTDFYSQNIGSAQRLPNGNTLICSGAVGKVFEVTAKGEVVWKYTIPQAMGGRGGGGVAGRGGAAGGGNGPQTFRALRYAADYPGLAGKMLTPAKGP